MRSCTPGNERALSVKTVPRIKKSFAWLYFFLAGLPGVTAGACGVVAELGGRGTASWTCPNAAPQHATSPAVERSEEHTSELQSQSNLVCRLLLEKKKKYHNRNTRVLGVIRTWKYSINTICY